MKKLFMAVLVVSLFPVIASAKTQQEMNDSFATAIEAANTSAVRGEWDNALDVSAVYGFCLGITENHNVQPKVIVLTEKGQKALNFCVDIMNSFANPQYALNPQTVQASKEAASNWWKAYAVAYNNVAKSYDLQGQATSQTIKDILSWVEKNYEAGYNNVAISYSLQGQAMCRMINGTCLWIGRNYKEGYNNVARSYQMQGDAMCQLINGTCRWVGRNYREGYNNVARSYQMQGDAMCQTINDACKAAGELASDVKETYREGYNNVARSYQMQGEHGISSLMKDIYHFLKNLW